MSGSLVRKAIFGLGLAVLGGALCSCATPYRPLKRHAGYTEKRLSPNEYEVSFLGNANTTWDRAFDFALFRAAEIAVSRNADSFILVGVTNLSATHTYMSANQYFPTASPYLSTGGQTVPSAPEFEKERSYRMLVPGEKRVFYEPGVRLRIQLPPLGVAGYKPYNSGNEIERLKQKYGLP